MSDFVSDFDPGSDGPWLGSAVMFDKQSFVSDCEQMQAWDCVYSIGLEHREASPESGDRLAVPDVVGALSRDGGQIPDHSDSDGCHSVMCTLQPDPGGDLVSALARFLIFIVALLQSVWFRRSRQKFAPGSWCRQKLVSAEVCVTGSCAGPSGGPSFGIQVVLCAFVAARVQFDLGGPKFVTTRASRTLVSAQPQLDVIQLCLSSSRSGWLSLLSGAGMHLSAVSVLLRWDFLCIIRTIARCRLRAQKGPLYDYACVRSEYTNGHHTVIDEWLFSGTCCIWCLVVLICCAGLSDRVFRCSVSHHIPRVCPGVFPAYVAKVVAADAASLADAGILFPADPVGTLSPTDQDGTLSPTDLAGYCSGPTLLGRQCMGFPYIMVVIMTILIMRTPGMKCRQWMGFPYITVVILTILIMRTPAIFFAKSGWIGVILTLQIDIMGFSRMMGRPSCLFLIARL